MFVACGIWCLADVLALALRRSRVCSDEGLGITLETSAACTYHFPQAKNSYKDTKKFK